MKCADFLAESLILAELRSTTREGALEEIVALLSSGRADVDPSVALHHLMERERLGSTGIGNGIAIPHAKLPRLRNVIGCVARSKDGVTFASLDGKPVHLILTLLAPENGAGMHLKALARVSRLFKDPEFRAQMMEAEDRAMMWNVICAEDRRLASNE